jgi:hypothetical protein
MVLKKLHPTITHPVVLPPLLSTTPPASVPVAATTTETKDVVAVATPTPTPTPTPAPTATAKKGKKGGAAAKTEAKAVAATTAVVLSAPSTPLLPSQLIMLPAKDFTFLINFLLLAIKV